MTAAEAEAKNGSSTPITDKEAELYDRQIRLWGLDAQTRLRRTRLCLAGLGGVGCEVAKNLVLAGLKSVHLVDQAKLGEEDLETNFLASREQLGENRAAASLRSLQDLNPLVQVTSESADIGEKSVEFFADFDLVIVTMSSSKSVLVDVNRKCREAKAKFLFGDCNGFHGYFFLDLLKHDYKEEVVVRPDADADADVDADADGPSKAKQPKLATVPETKMVMKTADYVDFESFFKFDFQSKEGKRQFKRLDVGFFAFLLLFRFNEKHHRHPHLSERDADLADLQKIRLELVSEYALPDAKLPESSLPNLFGETMATCAVVGGIMGQEVIKAVSGQDAPFHNFFCYNPYTGGAVVETLGGGGDKE